MGQNGNIRLLIIFILFSSLCFAQVHLGPGQSYSNLEAAVNAGAIHTGDTVYLHAGSYSGYQMAVKLKGDSSKYIVFKRYGNDKIDISGCWQFVSCAYIKLLNLNFQANQKNTGRLINVDNGGSCETQSNHIIIDSCTFSDVTDKNAITALKFGGVDEFQVTNCIFKDIPACDAMDFNVCHNGLISNNIIENCLSGGHIKGGASNITMERNLFLHAAGTGWVAFELGGDTGAQFYCPGDKFEVKELKFYSNLIIGGDRGLALSSARDCKVFNNTFYNCGQMTIRFLTTSSLYPVLSGNRVENNIFSFGSSAYINGSAQPAGAVTFRKNIYYSTTNPEFKGPYWDSPELDSVKDKEPLIYSSNTKMFLNATSNDFHLVAESPAVAAGLTEPEPVFDFYGNKFSTDKRSIGAIEFNVPSIVEDNNNHVVKYSIFHTDNELIISSINGKTIYSVEIYNIMGQQIYSAKPETDYLKIYTGNMSKGLYIIIIHNSNQAVNSFELIVN